MKTTLIIAAAIALNTLAVGPALAQAGQSNGGAAPPAATPDASKHKGEPRPPAQAPSRQTQPGAGARHEPPQGEPRPAKEDRPAERLGGEGGSDSRSAPRSQGGTGSTGQGGMPGSGASAGSGGTTDTR
ncbi:hypothetical protein [Achromobacter xylosoxidans]|uniref:hypothetical protein n=1 Tax=Alcaligenes xylosoxydans xylosoxydans TaxID=85698 RepID=UPI0034D41080